MGIFIFFAHSKQKRKIVVGNENLFAGSIFFRGNQEHLIFDINTKKIVNNESDIILHNRTWIGQEVVFLNKAIIPSNCVIGMRSIVNRAFDEEYCIIAGTPAEIKKHNIMWS